MKADEVISRVVDLCREYDAKKVILYAVCKKFVRCTM